MYSNMHDGSKTPKKGKIKMKDYQFLHDYLRELRRLKYEKKMMKKIKSKGSLKYEFDKPLRKARSMIIREKNVRWGLQNYNDSEYNPHNDESTISKLSENMHKEKKIDRSKRKKKKKKDEIIRRSMSEAPPKITISYFDDEREPNVKVDESEDLKALDKRRKSNFGTFNNKNKEMDKLKLIQNYQQSYSKQRDVTYTVIPKKGIL
jgi:hypothetical protein